MRDPYLFINTSVDVPCTHYAIICGRVKHAFNRTISDRPHIVKVLIQSAECADRLHLSLVGINPLKRPKLDGCIIRA